MSCPHCLSAQARGTSHLHVVTAGNPNTGKSTLINALSGANLQIGNWSGTTVERLEAQCRFAREGQETLVTLVDLPGAYSLDATTPEEGLTRHELLGSGYDSILNVLDAGNLERNLHLTLELTELGRPLVLALNLMDEAEAKGLTLAPGALERALGVPVIPTVASRKACAQTILSIGARCPEPAVRYPALIKEAAQDLTRDLMHPAKRWLALSALMGEKVPLSGLEEAAQPWRQKLTEAGTDPFLAIEDARYLRARELAQAALVGYAPTLTLTERIDRWVLHPLLGLPLFLLGMLLVFRFTFLFSAPWIDFIGSVQEVLSGWVAALPLPGLLASLVSSGLIGGVGTVLSFVPVLFFLYLALSFLETSGFLARAAFIADRLMQVVGLPGRAFIPLLLGLGCNVPAIYATRTLEHFPDRLRTALAVPFVSCSARLPVFVLLAAVFFPAQEALVVFGLYGTGLLVGLFTLWLLGRFAGGEASSGVMELPPYRLPPLSLLLRLARTRIMSFVRGAGGPILLGVLLVWLLLNVPVGSGGSLYGSVSQWLLPAFAPLGLTDARLVGALLSGFIAKEVVIGTLGASYLGAEGLAAMGFLEGLAALATSFQEAVLGTLAAVPALLGLPQALPEDVGAPSGLYAALQGSMTSAAALAYMVFVLLYTLCVATIGALKQEFGTRWAIFSIVYGLAMAFALALLASRF